MRNIGLLSSDLRLAHTLLKRTKTHTTYHDVPRRAANTRKNEHELAQVFVRLVNLFVWIVPSSVRCDWEKSIEG